jgi:hypothetical protein
MLARVFSACLAGVEAALVRVEVDVSDGLPSYTTVGLPDPAIRESRDRVRVAVRHGFRRTLENMTRRINALIGRSAWLVPGSGMMVTQELSVTP